MSQASRSSSCSNVSTQPVATSAFLHCWKSFRQCMMNSPFCYFYDHCKIIRMECESKRTAIYTNTDPTHVISISLLPAECIRKTLYAFLIIRASFTYYVTLQEASVTVQEASKVLHSIVSTFFRWSGGHINYQPPFLWFILRYEPKSICIYVRVNLCVH